MFGLGILEVGIGLALVFLAVSLACSTIREMIETISKTRAMDLERGLRELFADRDGKGVTQTLFSHPLINGLFGGTYDPENLKPTWGLAGIGTGFKMPLQARRTLPSYIPAGHFSAALLDIVMRGPAGNGGPATALASAYGAPPLSITGLRSAAATLENEPLRRVVLSAVDLAGDDLATVKTNLEAWFNGTMDRVSGWYKRRTQMLLFAIGLAVAIFLNVDAITIANRLGSDAALRAAVVSQAQKVVGSGTMQDAALTNIRGELDKVGFPIGWVAWKPAPQSQTGARSLSPGEWIQTIVGWLLTAFAVMLGAPFWFDVLNKFMVVRSTVKPHEKSPEEGSEDRQPASAPASPVTIAAAAPPAVHDGAARPAAGLDPMPPGYEPRSWNRPGMENEGIL